MFNINKNQQLGFKPKKKLLIKELIGGLGIFTLAALVLANVVLLKSDKPKPKPTQAATATYDIVVAGGGLGGVAASMQAARMGRRVLLVEETDWIGGQASTSGVNCIDVGDTRYNTGMYKEFENRAKQYYSGLGLSVNKCWTGVSFEPRIIQSTLRAMLAEQPNITLRTGIYITSVQKSASQIIGVTLNDAQTIATKFVVDATEYGDIIPLAGANYRVGDGSVNNGSTSIPSDACIQDITYTAPIKKYPAGVPTNLRITTPPVGYNSTIENNFKLTVKKDGLSSWTGQYPVNFAVHNTYRGMPNSTERTSTLTKTSVNWANDYPASSGSLSTKYLTDKNYRKQVNCEAKLKTYQFLYYMQSSTGLAEPTWSIANDERYDTTYNLSSANDCSQIPNDIEKYMSQAPYVRESIRMIGMSTLTAKNIKRTATKPWGATSFPSSIAIGSYGNDLHNCASDTTLESSLNESRSDISTSGGPYQIPMEALISNNVDGLIAAEKNISASRLASGAVRVHPSAMLNGQAAGALAAIAFNKNIKPKYVKPLDVQIALLQQKSMLVPFTDYDTNHKYFSDMQLIALRSIMVGYGNLQYGAQDSLKRSQMAVSISRAFAIPPVTPRGIFADVLTTNTFAPYIEAIYPTITSGCAVNPLKFCPENYITNQEFAVFALRGWQKINPGITTSTATRSYSDVSTTNIYYSYIEGLAGRGIKWFCNEPTNTNFCPTATVNRATASFVLNQILLKENR